MFSIEVFEVLLPMRHSVLFGREETTDLWGAPSSHLIMPSPLVSSRQHELNAGLSD